MEAKDFWRSQDEPTWTKVRKGIAKMDLSTGFGLYPFTVVTYSVKRKPNWDAKLGSTTSVYVNKETGVQVRYSYSKTRWYSMNDPADAKEYWDRRNATKAAFFRSMGWRK